MSGVSVVSYRNSTSNHNYLRIISNRGWVESYRNSTSNHNDPLYSYWVQQLYLIEILHQTTTLGAAGNGYPVLYLIEILHQTTTRSPLLPHSLQLYLIEILHQTTTKRKPWKWRRGLYLIEILHQTTTHPQEQERFVCCILSKFYIKPQLVRNYYAYSQVVSYRNSTSNHNGETIINFN